MLASGSDDNNIIIWDPLNDFNKLFTLTGHNSGVMSVCFSYDGKLLASGSDDGTVKIWDSIDNYKELFTFDYNYESSMCFSYDSKYLVFISNK